MKTLKEYIQLIEGEESSPGLRAVGVSPSSLEDGIETQSESVAQGYGVEPEKRTPVTISTTITSDANGMPTKSILVYANAETTMDVGATEENNELLRHVLKTGGVPMPDEDINLKNTSGITVIIANGELQANAYGESADKLLKLLQDAGLADEEGNAIHLQPKEQEPESEEEITEDDDAVSRVVKLSHELQKR